MKENNHFMAHQSSVESDDQIPSYPLGLNNPQPSKDTNLEKKQEEGPLFLSTHNHNHDGTQNPSVSKALLCNKEKIALQGDEALEEGSSSSGRERLKQHRVEVAGRVWIPELWGQEELLKDWIDCTAFDAPLVPSKITMARAALVEEGRRANAAALRIDNRC